MMRLIRPLTMIATFSETEVATPIFCSMTRMAISLSSPSRTSISSTWATITGARPSVGSSMMRRSRIGDERATDRQHLLLAAGELAAAVVLALGQPRESLVDALDRPRAALTGGDHAQVLVDRQ